MSSYPSAMMLLTETMAERALVQPGVALHGMLKDEVEAKERLKRLDLKLDTPLLGNSGIEELTADPLSDALAEEIDRRTTRQERAGAPLSDEFTEQRAMGRTPKPPMVGRWRRDRVVDESPQQAQPNESSANLNLKRGGRRKQVDKIITLGVDGKRSSEIAQSPAVPVKRMENPRSESTVDSDASHSKSPDQEKTKKQWAKAQSEENKGKLLPLRQPPSKIDARQAGEQMARRAAEAGAATAWRSPLNSSSQQTRTPQQQARAQQEMQAVQGQAAESAAPLAETCRNPLHELPARDEKPRARDIDPRVAVPGGITQGPESTTAVEQQIERYLKKLTPQKALETELVSGPARKKRTTATTADSPQVQNRGVETGGDSLFRRCSPQQEQSPMPESVNRSPGMPGGLRGLAARATGPLDESSRAAGTERETLQQAALSLPQPNRGVDSVATGTARTSVAEIAEILADEARRAGIDLEQFRP